MTSAFASHRVQEGKVRFSTAGAFYRPKSRIARDLAILVAHLYRRDNGQLRIFDAMTGCGVRPLRYVLEAGADWVWANEGNPDLAEILELNLRSLPPERLHITYQNARTALQIAAQQRDGYDLIDIDNFGSPAAFIHPAIGATRLGGLLYITSTDGRSTGGRAPGSSLRIFGAYARSHPAVHEQGLRLLIGSAAQVAASVDLGIEPVFSLFTGQVHRAMVRLVKQPTLAPNTYGFIAYCHRCGYFQTVQWRQLGRIDCPDCSHSAAHPPVVSGPMWLGPLHDPLTVNAMGTLADQWGWIDQAKLLTIMAREADLPPYYYSLGAVGHFGNMDIPNRERLIAALQEQGYRAAMTHLDHQAVKTDAGFGDCVAIAKTCHP